MPDYGQGDSSPVQLTVADLTDNLASYILGSWLNIPENETFKESLTHTLAECIKELNAGEEKTAVGNRLKDRTLKVQLFLANHQNTPEHVLDLLGNGDSIPVVTRVAEHPRTPTKTLERLSTHENPEVRCAVAQNANASQTAVRNLLKDADPTVRYDLAESYHLSKDVLMALAEDDNPYVSCRAMQTLSRLSSGMIPAGRTYSVFLVEDSEFLRSCLEMQVESMPGMDVCGFASDGKQALDAIMALRPDLVLMDIGLPGMDGITVTRAIKEAWPDCRIIMLTGHDTEDEILGAFDAGADGYFLKTSDYRLMSLAAEAVLGGGTWVDPAVAPTLLRHVIDRVMPQQNFQPGIGADINEPVMTLMTLAGNLRKKGKFEQAVSVSETAVMVAESEYGTSHELTAMALAQLADLHYSRAAYTDCEPFYLKLLMSKRQSLKPSSCRLERDLLALARLADMSGNQERAESIMSWYREITNGADNPPLAADAREQFRNLIDSEHDNFEN
jgi:DNA-binding NarL/FixJ family response regulator